MADKDSKKKDDGVEQSKPPAPPAKVEEKAAEPVAKVEEKAAEPVAKVEEKAAEPVAAPLLMSFDRWFTTLDKPEHHKAGMKAYANTSGKKSLEQWAAIFKNY